MNSQDQHESTVATRVRSLFPIIILSGLVLMLLSACDTEPKDWTSAKSTGTVASYDNFLARHPNGEFSEEARTARLRLLREKAWEEAASIGTIEAYKKVLEGEVKDDYAEKARSEITLLEDWQSAQNRNTIGAYETFISKHEKSNEAVPQTRRDVDCGWRSGCW